MKINRNLKITEKEFMDTLLEEVAKSILEQTKKEILVSELKKGYKLVFRQKNDFVQRISFEVLDYKPYTYYASKRTSVNGTVSVYYTVTPTEEGINVVLEQEFPRNKKTKKLFQMFSDIIYLGRMSDHLFDIQKKVIQKKEGLPDVEKSFFGVNGKGL